MELNDAITVEYR